MRMLLLAIVTLQAALCGATGTTKSDQWHTYKTTKGSSQSSSTGGLGFATQLALSRDQQLQYGPSFKQLDVLVQPQTADRLYVKIAPPQEQQQQQQRWTVPEYVVPRPEPVQGLSARELLYEVKQPLTAADQPFALTVTRKATRQPVFNTEGHSFLFKDQFIELTTAVPADSDLYGLGEGTLQQGLLLPRDGTIKTMWARDAAPTEADINTYGAHPFYLQVNKDGTAQGVFLLNSNGMDVILNKTSVTFRAIGGIVELYVFLGPTPEEVTRQYHQLIGKPMMPPYWALGAQQGKWGYIDIADLESVVINYTKAGLPLEALWVDIEAMNNRFQVFTFDKDRYPAPKMRQFASKLAAAGQHWAPIFNPGISVQQGYRAYEEGSAQGVWIKDVNGNPYKGQVWPGEVVYPSYLGDTAAAWLKSQMKNMYDQVPFDGMWLDMSEAANFCSGMVCEVPRHNKTAVWALELPTPLDFNATLIQKLRCYCQLSCKPAPASNKLANPPYAMHNFGWKEGLSNNDDDRVKARDGNMRSPLDMKSISVTATHPDGTLEYNAHNLYGTSMARHFHNTYRDVSGKRVFMLTRSTFPGAGRWTGHWTGDTKVTWQALQEQTAYILSANLWGVAMTGADICGYGIDGIPKMNDQQLQELCVRWTSAGAFYPFSRNHQNWFTLPHEPYRWSSTTAAAKKAYGLRYRLLTYLYGSMYSAHKKGGTLARPIFFNDPSDLKARNANQQWMMGEALMVSPVVTNTTSVITPHFTAGAWYSAWDYSRLDSTGQAVRMDVPLGDIAVHLRGGAIVPMQQYAPVTRDMRWSPVNLVVALPAATATTAPAGSPAAAPAGPVLPYDLDQQCAQAREQNTDKLVSCGLLYADDDAPEASDANSLQAWFTALTDKDGDSGTISSTVTAAAPQLSDRLRITQIEVIGLAKQMQAGSGGSSGTSKASQAHTSARTSMEAWRSDKPAVSVSGPSMNQGSAAAEYDGSRGVLRITGLNLLASEPFSINWRMA